MKKTNLILPVFLFFVSFVGTNLSTANAQTFILNESLLNQTSFNKFTAVSVKGAQVWYLNTQYGAVISGFANSTSNENEDWLISPEMDLLKYDDLKLSFEHTRGPAGSINAGMSEGWYKVYATAAYTGDVTKTEWVEISGVNHTSSAWYFVSSGELSIPASVKSGTVRIAFKYLCNNSQSATWEVKNVKVSGKVADPNAFKITTWNVEWLSCTEFGPSDEELQINNVVSVIKSVNPDFIALQEVGTSGTYTTIDTLVRRLGNEWAGKIVPWKNDNCSQSQGIIYKKSKVQLVNSSLITNGGSSYNWSNGRLPVLYNINFLVAGESVPVSFVNIHAKALGDETSYTRRKDASIGLKSLLDGSTYNTKKVVVIGDFNDYLIGTQCNACGQNSPYKNFTDDTNNYRGITKDFKTSLIDHIIISNELFDNYVPNSVEQEISATYDKIPSYTNTTSGHIPVSAMFRFTGSSGEKIVKEMSSTIHIYPNPGTGIFTISGEGLSVSDRIEIFSITGLSVGVWTAQSGDTVIDLTAFPAGYYFIKIKDKVAKIVKQ